VTGGLPLLPDRELLGRFRESLLAGGYTEDRLLRLLRGPIRLSFMGMIEVARRRLAGDAPDRTLSRLFWLGSSVARADAKRALAGTDLAELAAAGVVALDDDDVRPLVGIAYHDGLYFAHDPDRVLSGRSRDFVTGVNASSALMDWLTIRREVTSALDLGTGCGVQALLAARHARAVTALDVNPRALRYAAFNAALNGVENLEVLEGRWFEPVAGRRFDLLVANLPFVVSPDTTYDYRDSAEHADSASRTVLAQAGEHLEEGGFAHVFCNWVVPRGADWREPLEACIDGTGCDGVLILHGRHDPLSYAARWNHPLDEEDPPGFAATLDRWLSFYREHRIEEIADGMVVLRRRSTGLNFVRGLEVHTAPSQPAGAHLLRLFEGYDAVRALPDPYGLLAVRLVLAAPAIVDQRAVSAAGRLAPGKSRIRLPDGIGLTVTVDPRVAHVLALSDGRRPLRAVVDAVTGDDGNDAEQLTAEVATEAARLLGLGFLVVSG
jgi:methylase of polypeptide subunit release factors